MENSWRRQISIQFGPAYAARSSGIDADRADLRYPRTRRRNLLDDVRLSRGDQADIGDLEWHFPVSGTHREIMLRGKTQSQSEHC